MEVKKEVGDLRRMLEESERTGIHISRIKRHIYGGKIPDKYYEKFEGIYLREGWDKFI